MVRALQNAGFELTHVRGSHHYLRLPDTAEPLQGHLPMVLIDVVHSSGDSAAADRSSWRNDTCRG